MPPTLTLYTRAGCHLCSAAEQLVRPIAAERGATLTLLDIDAPSTDPILRAHYDHAVPVVHVGGREVARHRIEAEAVHTALDFASTHFCLFAKYPTPGKVKTRLTVGPGALTPDQAAGVHRACLLHLIRRFLALGPASVTVAFDPPDAEPQFRSLVGAALPDAAASVRWLPQSRGDLGDRLASAQETLSRDGLPVLHFGCDAPDVPDAHLASAVRSLHRPRQIAVIGPTTDGGYWTLGAHSEVKLREVLHAIPWSSGTECAATVERLAGFHYGCVKAPHWEDVDHPPDLDALRGRLTASAVASDRALLDSLNTLLTR